MDRNGMAGSCVALLCGAMMPCPGHAQLSVPDAFSRMRGHQITGATVITHGFQPLDTLGNSLMPLAQAIRDELSDQSGDNVWLLDYELNDAGATGFYNTANSVLPAAGAALQSGHVVLLWDWAPESHDTNGRWADSVGDALFSHLVGMRIANPRNPAASPPIHMIGHSFGTGVTSEAVERLATWQVPVANLTYLDPHDFDQADIEVDEDQQIFSLGRPPGYGATVWNNVEFADVYYQTRGQQGAGVQLFTADPEGRPIPGAANHLLVDELPSTASGNPYGLTQSDHSYVWAAFYQATITGAFPAEFPQPASDVDVSQTGWAYSSHNTNQIPQPAPQFFTIGTARVLEHDHSNPDFVVTSGPDEGNPNATGLQANGFTEGNITHGRFAPDWQPNDIVNGSLDGASRQDLLVDLVAGWSHHGGGGDANRTAESIAAGESNHFLEIDFGDDQRTHNFLYVPRNATELVLRTRVADASSSDIAQVRIGDQVIGQIDISAQNDWQTTTLPIPAEMRDVVSTITVEVLADGLLNVVDTTLHVDDFSFEMVQPELALLTAAGIVDFGVLQSGESAVLSGVLQLGNVTDNDEAVLDVWSLDFQGAHGDLFASPDFSFTELMMGATTEFDLQFFGTAQLGEYQTSLMVRSNGGEAPLTLRAMVVPEPNALWGAALLAFGLFYRGTRPI